MLTFEDCLNYCDLSEDEVDVVAEHEHLPGIVACELASCLLCTSEGQQTFMRFLEDDMLMATMSHNSRRLATLNHVKAEFSQAHTAT